MPAIAQRKGYIRYLDNPSAEFPVILDCVYRARGMQEAANLLSAKWGFQVGNQELTDIFSVLRRAGSDLKPVSQYLGARHRVDMKKLVFPVSHTPRQEFENDEDAELAKIDGMLRKNQTTSLIDIANTLDVSPQVAIKLVDLGRSRGYRWGKISDGIIYFADSDTAPMGHARVIQIKPVTKKLIFGVMSDTHYGSKVCMKDEICDFVDTVYATGARTIFHCGDAIDNNCVYQNQASEIEIFGIDQQIDMMIEHLPKKPGLTYYLVLGNHDLKSQRKYGFNISRELTEARKDIIYLGDVRATVKIPDDKGIDVMLRHSGKGSQAYAMSYPLQRLIQNLPGGSKPNVFIGGHVHYGIYLPQYRNVHAMYAGCFQGETTLTMEKEIPVSVGGWICRVSLDEGNWSREFSPSWIGYYLGTRGASTGKKSTSIHRVKKIPGWEEEK